MFERGSEEFMLFTDFWNIAKKYWIVNDNDNYWEDFIAEADAYTKKHKNCGLARHLVNALANYLEDKAKENRKYGND